MVWTAADYQTYQYSLPITAVSQAARTVSVATDILQKAAVGDRTAISGSANAGSYTIAGLTYAPDTTILTLGYDLPSAVVAGNLLLGPNDRTRVARLDEHIVEVTAQISASVSSDGTSLNSDTLQRYLADLRAERLRLSGAARGKLTRGRLVFP
jgi:hypothetical protein